MTHVEQQSSEAAQPTMYQPDILPLMQSLLATLADIDFQFEKDLEVIRASAIDEALRHTAIMNLRQQHYERRAAYLGDIAALEKRMEVCFSARSS